MSRKKIIICAILALGLMFSACGKKVNRQNMGPDEYFEYAKSKYDKGKYLTAVTEFSVIVLKFSGNPVVDDAQYYLGMSHYHEKEYIIAISEFEKLLADYPQSQYTALTQFMIAKSYYELSLRPELDQDYTRKAIRKFQEFIEENPDHEFRKTADELRIELRKKLAKKKMIAATTYRKMGVNDAAVIYLDIIINEFYDTPYAAQATYWKGECLYRLKKYSEALTTLTVFVEKYPSHQLASRAKRRISDISDLPQRSEQASSILEEN